MTVLIGKYVVLPQICSEGGGGGEVGFRFFVPPHPMQGQDKGISVKQVYRPQYYFPCSLEFKSGIGNDFLFLNTRFM